MVKVVVQDALRDRVGKFLIVVHEHQQFGRIIALLYRLRDFLAVTKPGAMGDKLHVRHVWWRIRDWRNVRAGP